jgi:adenylate cyclase class IV
MKITSFGPEVMVTDAEPVIQLFKDLGFEPRHHQEGITEKNIEGNVLRDANGFRMNILQVNDLPRPAISTIRMNVDNFEEAYELLKSHGFTEAPGAFVTNTGSAKSLMMMSPSRFLINVVQHIKED